MSQRSVCSGPRLGIRALRRGIMIPPHGLLKTRGELCGIRFVRCCGVGNSCTSSGLVIFPLAGGAWQIRQVTDSDQPTITFSRIGVCLYHVCRTAAHPVWLDVVCFSGRQMTICPVHLPAEEINSDLNHGRIQTSIIV